MIHASVSFFRKRKRIINKREDYFACDVKNSFGTIRDCVNKFLYVNNTEAGNGGKEGWLRGVKRELPDSQQKQQMQPNMDVTHRGPISGCTIIIKPLCSLKRGQMTN